MIKILCLLLVSSFFHHSFAQDAEHRIWNDLLKKHVSVDGNVNYKGIKADRSILYKYTQALSNTDISELDRKAAMAFWINAYNAFTIQLILDHYPVQSIMDIKFKGQSAWDHPFISLGKKTYTLNEIEHEILLKQYFDPRIHFVINCAAISCPKLLNRAITADNLDQILEQAAIEFINNKEFNKISNQKAQLSRIFDWYHKDFTRSGSLSTYINKYSKIKIDEKTKIEFLAYNWGLNEK